MAGILDHLPDFEETLSRLVKVPPSDETNQIYSFLDERNEIRYRIYTKSLLSAHQLRRAVSRVLATASDDPERTLWDFVIDNWTDQG
jgi:hypothetical protein